MEDFRRQFLVETAEKLENLHQILRDGEDFSAETKRETFRLLHTVKGTAQTFGYAATSRLAHDLETLLCAAGDGKKLLVEGIEFLRASLAEEEFQLSERFRERLESALPKASANGAARADSQLIPAEFYSQLSSREKDLIRAAIDDGKNLAVLEIGFAAAEFAAGLMNFRQALNSSGEIVATFPSAKFAADGKIGFQFLTANLDDARRLAADNDAAVLWENSNETAANDPDRILRQIVRHGTETAAKFGKRIAFETEADRSSLSAAESKIVFETLLHLVRNAVDHAIENAGTIKISLKIEPENLRLAVSDDGRGIDLELVKARAFESGLISKDEFLDEAKTLALIFQPHFSTKTETNEISGRGIGLDAVKSAVEKRGGTISVETAAGKGARFEIVVPREQN